MNSRCIYFVEGPCEDKLISAIKLNPSIIIPGKVKVYNVIQELIPNSQLLAIPQGALVVFVYDTDVDNTEYIKKNIKRVKQYCRNVKLVNLMQVKNFEEELERATDVKRVQELTKSSSIKNFKADFCRLKDQECRNMLERHRFDVHQMWNKKASEVFAFAEKERDAGKVMIG